MRYTPPPGGGYASKNADRLLQASEAPEQGLNQGDLLSMSTEDKRFDVPMPAPLFEVLRDEATVRGRIAWLNEVLSSQEEHLEKLHEYLSGRGACGCKICQKVWSRNKGEATMSAKL